MPMQAPSLTESGSISKLERRVASRSLAQIRLKTLSVLLVPLETLERAGNRDIGYQAPHRSTGRGSKRLPVLGRGPVLQDW